VNSDRASKNTSWANKCQAPPAAPGASAQGGARQVLEKYDLLGVWSVDCSGPPSPNNAYVVYRALDQQLVQYDVMSHPTERDWACIIESAVDAVLDNSAIGTSATQKQPSPCPLLRSFGPRGTCSTW
jgi:hypothetical protein